RLGRADDERHELAALVADEPGDAPAIERLAVLEFQRGDTRRSEELRRSKAGVDRAQDRIRKLLLEPVPAVHAGELAELSRALGRGFDARGWSLVAEALGPGAAPKPGLDEGTAQRAGADFPPALKQQAIALSAPFNRPAEDSGPRLAERLADLLGSAPTAIARGPDPAPGTLASAAPAIRFADEADAAGLRFVFDNGQTARHLMPETMSGGVGLIDYDGDGWLDVYCVQGGPLFRDAAIVTSPGSSANAAGDRLFRNRGDGTFEDVTERSRIAAIAGDLGYGMGVAVGDYDNDGDPDLFVTRVDAYALFRNRGDGTFENVTDAAGLAGHRDNPSSSAFADLDGDGDLDLYVCHYMKWDPAHPPTCTNERGEYFYCDPSKVEPAPDHAFRNDAGRFVDVTNESGLAESAGRGLGVVACDLDGDGRVDLYVANDGTANYLFRNKGGFRFEEIALEAGVAGSASGGYQAGMGVACGDLDGDGRPDLLVTNFYGEGTTYHHNLGQGLFDDLSSASGLGLATRYLLGFGIAMADVGNVGRPDVMIVNGHVNDNRPNFPYAMPARLYANRPDGRLVDISKSSGACWQVPRVARGLAVGDLDNDGRPDAVILPQNDPVEYFHNRSEHVGRFLTIGLEGTKSNRDGVGARVVVEAGGRKQAAWRIGGGSYQSAGDPRLHFGFGTADRVESVEVFWPSGRVDRHPGLEAGMGYLLREGEARARPLAGWDRPAARPSQPPDSSRSH
ncbi:MAG: CRTAC1 family protein, partial [Isosphaeraceae bacterium]